MALAAGPFVIMALRKKETNGLPLGEYSLRNSTSEVRADFFEEWKSIYNKFDTTFEKDNAISTARLQLDFSHSRNWSFQSLSTRVFGNVFSLSECVPNNLISFEVTEGAISIDNGTLKVSIAKRESKEWGIDEEASRKTGTKIVDSDVQKDGCVSSITRTVEITGGSQLIEKIDTVSLETCGFIVRNEGKGIVFRPIDRNGREITSAEAKQANYPFQLAETVRLWLMHSYPKDSPLKVGVSVNLPREKVLMNELPHKAVFEGVGKIANGIRVANFMSDQTYNTKQLREHYRDCIVFLREQGVNNGDDLYEKIIEETVKYKRERRQILKNYVDLTTGLTVRHETFVRDSTNVSAPTAAATVFQIS
jgi:hypothetical protein